MGALPSDNLGQTQHVLVEVEPDVSQAGRHRLGRSMRPAVCLVDQRPVDPALGEAEVFSDLLVALPCALVLPDHLGTDATDLWAAKANVSVEGLTRLRLTRRMGVVRPR